MRRNVVDNVRRERLAIILSGVLSCIGVVSLSVLLFSFIVSKIDLPNNIISLMSSVSLCAGCVAAGYSVSKRRRRNGLFTGVLCGIVIFFIILFIGIIFVKSFTIMGFITKFFIILACSAIGGVIGVNSPLRFR